MKKFLKLVFAAILVTGTLYYSIDSMLVYKESKPVDVIRSAKNKTVMVYVTADTEQLNLKMTKDGFKLERTTVTVSVTGAGVFISPNGHVLGCAHVVDFKKIHSIKVRDNWGHVVDAELLSKDDKKDLSVLKAQLSRTPYARLQDPRSLRVGQQVYAIGNPHGLEFSVSRGIISALNRDLMPDAYNLVQTDSPVNPGNSGGPLFDSNGGLVGIVILKAPYADGLGFAVDPGQIIEFLTRFRGIDRTIPKEQTSGFLAAFGL